MVRFLSNRISSVLHSLYPSPLVLRTLFFSSSSFKITFSIITSNCLLLLLLCHKENNYFKQVCTMSIGCHLAYVLHSSVLSIWATISSWKRIRTACITLCNVQTPEFSPWCLEEFINSFSRISQKGIRILAAVEMSNKTLCNGGRGGITTYTVLQLYNIYSIIYCTTSYTQFATKNC